MTAGARSTEFYLACFGLAFGIALSVAGLFMFRDVAVASGAGIVGLTIVGYGHARAKTKHRPYLPPAGRL